MIGYGRWRSLWPWLAVLLIAALAAQPLWGLPPQGDDLLLHFYRIPLVNAQWAAGVPLARWQPDLIYGYGSPLFTFYPPLSAWLLTLLYWLTGQQAAVAINLLFAFCVLLGAVGMFGLGRALVGELGGLLATAVFTLSPHVAAQIYSRGSTSNSLALGLVPLAAWLIWRVAERPSARRIALGAVGIALLMLAHTAVSLLLLGPLLVWGVVAVAVQNVKPQRRWLPLLALFGLGLGLSAFAWLPALSEIHFTRYAAEANKVFYGDHFTTLWRWPGQAVAGLRGAYLPKTVGLVALLLGSGGTAVSAWSLWRWRNHRGERPFPGKDLLFLTAGLLGWSVLFFTLPASELLWRFIAPLRSLQFPWRLLDVPAFFLPLAGLRLVIGNQYSVISNQYSVISNQYSVIGKRYFGGVVAVILIGYVNLVPYLYPPRWADLPDRPALAEVTAVQQKYQIIGLTAWGEYSDARVTAWPSGPAFAGADAGATLAQKLLTAVPASSLNLIESDPWRASWLTSFAQPQTLTFASHVFPGWQAHLDSETLPVGADENGRLQLTVPAGSHELTVQFGRTAVRWLADFLSVAGLLICLWLVISRGWRLEMGDGRLMTLTHLPSPISPYILVAGVAILLLLGKIFWLDRFDSPLVVHPVDGRIPAVPTPPAGNFNNEIQLVGVQTELPNSLTLYWQALQPPTQAYRVALTLLDGQNVPRQTIINPTPGYTVTSHWTAGLLVRDAYTVPLPDAAPAGYTVQLSLLQPDEDFPLPIMEARGDVTLAIARLKQPPPATAVPSQATPIGTKFGESIVLSHAFVPETVTLRQPLVFSLVWEVETAVTEDYTVFVHLLTPEGAFVAGQDAQPLDGLYSTSFWGEGETVVDGRSWFADVPPGEYQLQVGLYLLATGQRLPVSGPNSELGDRVKLQTITIVP